MAINHNTYYVNKKRYIKLYIPARANDPCTLPPSRPTESSKSMLSNSDTKLSSETGQPAAYKLISPPCSNSNAAILS